MVFVPVQRAPPLPPEKGPAQELGEDNDRRMQKARSSPCGVDSGRVSRNSLRNLAGLASTMEFSKPKAFWEGLRCPEAVLPRELQAESASFVRRAT